MDTDNNKFSLIYKYFPLLKNAENTAPILEKMGLSISEIRDIYHSGHSNVYFRIIDPDSGIEHRYLDNLVSVSIEIKEDAGESIVAVNGVPYKEFFRLLEAREESILKFQKAPSSQMEVFFDEYWLLRDAVRKCDPEFFDSICQSLRRKYSEESNNKK